MKAQLIKAIVNQVNNISKKTMELLNTMNNTQLMHLLNNLEKQ